MQTALVIAHPGHELRVYGWVSLTQPLVFVLTDGSGSTGRSRLPSTRHILTETGARPGSIFGHFTDGAAYTALLDRNFNVAIELSEEIARELDAAGVELVAGDAVEGYNPVHDVCRLIINTAVARTAKNIRNYDFPLMGKPDQWRTGAAQVVQLDEPLLQRKLNAARQYEELTGEVDEALRAHGLGAFREEVLRPAPATAGSDGLSADKPFYETHGELRVRSGTYARVLRRREHLLPLAEALWRSLP